MATFSGNITVSGTVTFLGGAVNAGTINGAATFKDTSNNAGTINGNSTFLDKSTNNGGTVNGTSVYTPPLLASWVKLKFAPDEPAWTGRKIQTYRVYGGQTNQNYPQQACPGPNDGCYSYPDTYKPLVPTVNYVLDYLNHPEYCLQPGNACAGIVDTPPLAPTNVVGISGPGRVKLSWSAPIFDGGKAISDYIVEYSMNDGTTWNIFNDDTTRATSAVVTQLINGLSYVFRVAAVNELGTSEYSDKSLPVIPVTVPDAPTNLILKEDDAKVDVEWTPPALNGGSAIIKYVVQYREAGKKWKTFGEVNAPTTKTTVTNLINGKTYTFQVAAENIAGAGLYSAESDKVTPRTVPNAPTAAIGTPGNQQVSLKWAAPAFNGGAIITHYEIEINGGGITRTVNCINPTTVIGGLINGVGYSFRIAAVNVAGVGLSITAKTKTLATIITPRTIPNPPSLTNADPGVGTVGLSWTANFNGGAPITDYLIRFSKDNGLTWTNFRDAVSSNTAAVVTKLKNGVNYFFQVAAINIAGTSAYSNIRTATPRTIPGTPRFVTGIPQNTVIYLSWLPPTFNGGTEITNYFVDYSPDGITWTRVSTLTTLAVIENLVNGVPYTFKVWAANVVGVSTRPAAAKGITPRTVPDPPSNIVATAGKNQVKLTWSAPVANGGAPIKDYQILYSADSVNWYLFADNLSAATSATVTGLTAGVSYFFKVAAINIAGPGDFVATDVATTPTA